VWYLRGTFDDGAPLGSGANTEARIDSLPQSWAWLSGAADPARADQALESAWQHLVREDDGLVLLFEPPFDTAEPSPGYIKGIPRGAENGAVHRRPLDGHGHGPQGGASGAAPRLLSPIETPAMRGSLARG
jgi:cyclic beta-1,2-glucan synthetase